MYAIDCQHVSKTYKGGHQALDDVSLTVEAGDFFALLGPNGAGKSTLIGILTSLVRKSTGQVKLFGTDIDADFITPKSLMGVVPQEINLNFFGTVHHGLTTAAGYYGMPLRLAKARADYLLERVGLWSKRKASIKYLSGGMKRRLMVARALMHEPKLLLLDEPTAGVDIEIRRAMWSFVTDINESEGVTVLLTTHYLEEAEQLCKNVAILNHGKIIRQTKMSSLLGELHCEQVILYPTNALKDCQTVKALDLPDLRVGCDDDDNAIEVTLTPAYPLTRIITALEAKGVTISSMRNKNNRLEALFLQLTSGDAHAT